MRLLSIGARGEALVVFALVHDCHIPLLRYSTDRQRLWCSTTWPSARMEDLIVSLTILRPRLAKISRTDAEGASDCIQIAALNTAMHRARYFVFLCRGANDKRFINGTLRQNKQYRR